MRRKYSLRPLLPKYWFQISRKSQPRPLTQWFLSLGTQQRFSQIQILGPHSAGLEGDVPNMSPGTCIFKLLVRWCRGNWANMESPCSWGYVLTPTLWVLGTPEKWQCHRSCRWGLEGLRRSGHTQSMRSGMGERISIFWLLGRAVCPTPGWLLQAAPHCLPAYSLQGQAKDPEWPLWGQKMWVQALIL